MAYTVGMVSLGCAKNQVDGEMLLASLKEGGFQPCLPEGGRVPTGGGSQRSGHSAGEHLRLH